MVCAQVDPYSHLEECGSVVIVITVLLGEEKHSSHLVVCGRLTLSEERQATDKGSMYGSGVETGSSGSVL